MGKTRTKIIKDELVEKLKAELGVEEKKETAAEPKAKAQKPDKSKPRSKKYQQVSKDLDRSKTYTLDEAIELTKKLSYTKFDGTLEAHINTIKSPVIHRGLGKLSQPTEELVANVKILLSTIGKTKIKKVSLSPTMGPSVRIDLTSL